MKKFTFLTSLLLASTLFGDIENIVNQINKKTNYPIDGYFIHYGQGPYDWIYNPRGSDSVFKLEGLDQNGNFKRISDEKIHIPNITSSGFHSLW
ncbi:MULTISPECIES: hypothetical protein [unclassified Nitratiruptor]|uniref:hypothetical protein n=1 Tax=unclassified Nitratiruptor TaxID=2624044 RepID=UPI0019162D13|nr:MULTISPECIES: hypothetical protein [unclassified Nitratiruptor]